MLYPVKGHTILVLLLMIDFSARFVYAPDLVKSYISSDNCILLLYCSRPAQIALPRDGQGDGQNRKIPKILTVTLTLETNNSGLSLPNH